MVGCVCRVSGLDDKQHVVGAHRRWLHFQGSPCTEVDPACMCNCPSCHQSRKRMHRLYSFSAPITHVYTTSSRCSSSTSTFMCRIPPSSNHKHAHINNHQCGRRLAINLITLAQTPTSDAEVCQPQAVCSTYVASARWGLELRSRRPSARI